MKARRFGSYLRVSSNTQVKQATIETQDAELRASYQREGVDPDTEVYWFRDAGISGDLPIWEREGASKMRDYVERGLITEEIRAYHINRVNRDDVLSYFELELLCDNFNLTLRTLIDNVDTSTEEGQLLGGLGALLARKAKREQLKVLHDGKLRKVRSGWWPGRPPYGHLRVDGGKLVVNPPQADAIWEMVRLVRDEHQSASAIADEFEARGIPTYLNKKWSSGRIISVLRNPSLIGKAMYNRSKSVRKRGRLLGREARDETEWIVVPCPRILDDETYYEVQAILDDNARAFERTGVIGEALMLQHVTCRRCEARFYGQRKKNRDEESYRHYYAHRWTGPKATCIGRGNIVAERLERRVWERVLAAMRDTERWRGEVETQLFNDSGLERRLARATERLTSAEAAIQRLEEAHFLRQTMSAERYDALAPAYTETLQKARREVASLEAQLAQHRAKQARVMETASYMEEILARAETASPALRKEICAKLIREVVVLRDGPYDAFDTEIVWL